MVWKGLEIGGTRGLSLLRTMILARLLVPDDFGLLAVGIVTMDFGRLVTSFGIWDALIQQRAPSREQYDTAWTFDVVRAVLVAAVLILTAPFIAEQVFDEPRATDIIRALAIAPVIDRFASIEAVTLMRELRLRRLAGVGLTGSIVHATLAVILARPLGVWGMVVGQLVGVAAQTTASYVVAPRVPRLSFRLEAARPLLRFGWGVLARSVVEMVGGAVLQVAIARRLGMVELGVYYVAARVAFLPKDVVYAIGRHVLFPVHAALQLERGRAALALRGHLLGSWLVLVPLSAIVIAIAPSMVAHLVGLQWSGAVPAIRILTVAAVIGLVCDAATPLLLGRGRTGEVAFLFGIRSAVMVGLVWSLAGALGVQGACMAWVIGEVTAAMVAGLAVRAQLPEAFSGLAAPGLAVGGAAVVAASLAMGIDHVSPGLWGVVLSAVLALSAALGLLWWLDARLRLGLVAEVGRVVPTLAGRLQAGRGDAAPS